MNVTLDLRGARITIDKRTLLQLPESLLLCLFPNGVVLSSPHERQGEMFDDGSLPTMSGDPEEDIDTTDVYYVDFDADTLQYILHFFQEAHDEFYGLPEGPQRILSDTTPPPLKSYQSLFQKQGIIVLREELDYFVIPPKGGSCCVSSEAQIAGPSKTGAATPSDSHGSTLGEAHGGTPSEPHSSTFSDTHSATLSKEHTSGSSEGGRTVPVRSVSETTESGAESFNTAADTSQTLNGALSSVSLESAGDASAALPSGPLTPLDPDTLNTLKVFCGHALLKRPHIFTALQRNVSRENNAAEQHLIDMLCLSGFDRDHTWAHRSYEPDRCSISSVALVLLKTGIQYPSIEHSSATHPTVFDESGELSPESHDPSSVFVNAQQLSIAYKLLFFWRKPARKCWWDAVEIPYQGQMIKVWARRVWTLELSLI